MQCPETLVGSEHYFVLLALVVGGLVNVIKRIKWIRVNAVPAIAFGLGWALDAAAGSLLCGLSYTDAGLSGLGGGLAGLAAAGGHEALMRTASAFGLSKLAARVLGKAKEEQDARKKASTALIVLLALSSAGCASLLPALAKAAQGAQWIGTVIDVADAGSSAYFARHPNLESERKVDDALRASQGALAALNAALASAEAATDEDVVKARSEALKAYNELYKVLSDLGVLTATPPDGGAETDAPTPEPLDIPKPEQLGATW